MAGFHNPYMQTPDFGQGISDFKDKALMVLLAMMGIPPIGLGGGDKSTETSVQTPTPAPNLQSPLPLLPTPQDVLGGAPGPAQMQDQAPPQMDPQMMQMLMRMLMQQSQTGGPQF